MKRIPVTAVLLAAVGLFLTTDAPAQISIDFDILPTAQGWAFESGNRTEPDVFSLAGGVLTMDSLGTGLRPEEAWHMYEMLNVVDPALPFSISWTARVLQDETLTASFGIGAFTGTNGQGVYIGNSYVALLGTTGLIKLSESIDTANFHDYRLEATLVTDVDLFVDNTYLGSAPWVSYPTVPNKLDFGDRTMDGNSHVEITSYTFDQAGPALNSLVADVLDLNLQTGISNSLDAKLDNALSALDDVNEHNDVAASNSLQAFINAVEAQRGHKIAEAEAEELIAAAQAIIDYLMQ